MALRLGKSLILLSEKLVKLACLVKLAFTHHEERVVGGPTDSSASHVGNGVPLQATGRFWTRK
jgi:hypothetical protein